MSGPRTSIGNPRSKSAKGKGIATVAGAPHPWPRPAGQRFTLPDSSLPFNADDQWDQTDAYYYNNWLEIELEPTRFVCPTTLMSLGLHHEVSTILARAQLTELVSTTDVLYPDLVRQCLASAKLTFTNPKAPLASQGMLSFFLNGRKHAISISSLCALYGFDSGSETVALPSSFKERHAFWNFIASGQYASRQAAQSSIRHPALRIAAKALSMLLFAQDNHSKVRIAELVLLYNGVRDTLSAVPDLSSDVDLDVNMGAVFASVIAEKRTLTGKGRTERVGGLLTRLFTHLGVDLRTTPCNDDERLMDVTFFINCQILAAANVYRFTGRDDRILFCRLPQPSLTHLGDGGNIGFTPADGYLCDEQGEAIPESTPAGAPAPETTLDDEEEEDLNETTANVRHSRANMRRPSYSEIHLRDIQDEPSDQEYRSWMVESTKRNNGLLRRILFMLQKSCASTKATATAAAQPAPAPRPPAPPSAAAPSHSGRTTRSSKRKKPTTDDDVEVDTTDIYAMSDD